MKYLLIILALVTGAAAGPFGTGGGGSSATAETAEVARKSLVTDSTIYRDTLVQWDSIPGANDSALVAVRDTLNQDMSDSLANYLHKTAFDDSFAAHAKDSLGNWTFTGDTATVSGDTGVFNKPLRATKFFGDGSNLTGVAASGGGGFIVNLQPGNFGYTKANAGPLLFKDVGTNWYQWVHPFDGTANETLYYDLVVPKTASATDYLVTRLEGYSATAAANDTVVFAIMYKFIADGESWDQAVTYRDTLDALPISATQDQIDVLMDSIQYTTIGATANDKGKAMLVRLPGATKDDHNGVDYNITGLKQE